MDNLFGNIKVFPLKKEHPVILANGNVLVAGTVQVNFTIKTGKNGIFASLPGHMGKAKAEDGTLTDKWYSDVFLPDEEVRTKFQQAVVGAYKAQVGGQKSAGEEPQDVPSNDGLPF